MSTAAAHAHEEMEHHYSIYPLIIGIGAFFSLLGVAYMPTQGFWTLIPGTIIFLWGVFGWTSEDTRMFDDFPRAWEGKHVGYWGMMGFLVTEVMTFGSLFAAYFAKRASADVWPPADVHLPVSIALVNTAILIASGFVLHWGEGGLKSGNKKRLNLGLGGAVLLGIIFLGIQAMEYAELIHEGVTLSHSAWASAFYLLTGFHGFHVLVGVLLLGTMLVRSLLGNFDADRHVAIDASAIYWHFVDVVWIFLVIVIYLGVI